MDRETLLEKYVQGELTEKERQKFDALLKNNADFKGDVEFHTNLKRVTEADDDDKFRGILSEFEAEASTQNSIEGRLPTKWLVAAAIALTAGLAYFFTIDSSVSTKNLFVQNFEPYPNTVNPIVRGVEDDHQKTKAFVAYQIGKYEEALPLFTKLYTTEKIPYYLFYRANALIQLNRAAEAIPLLQEHLKTKDKLTDKSNWYLAMAYLQLDDKANAKKMLNLVVNEGDFKVVEAQRLLEELD